MATLFTLLLLGYLISFTYKAFNNTSNNHISGTKVNNKPTYNIIENLIKKLSYVYNKSKKFICAQALYVDNISQKFNKYLIIALLFHIILLFIFEKWIVFPKIKNDQNWVYTEISTKEIEEKIIEDSAPPIDSDNFNQSENIENPQEDGSISLNKEVFNEKINVPVEYASHASIPQIIHNNKIKKSINLKLENSNLKDQVALGYGDGYNGKGLYGIGKGFGFGKVGKKIKQGKILGNTISAEKLGVILDISPSMLPYISTLKQEIQNNFNDAKIIHINGCSISIPSDTLVAFKKLINENVDAIYWFCDLQDLQSREGLEMLDKILKSKNIKLYIKSMDQPPSYRLKSIISSNGGNYFLGLN